MRSTCPFLTRNTAIFCSLTALTLAGCASIEPAGHATSDAVTMRFVQTDRPDLGADTCQIAVEASYPADMPTHERTLTIRDTASTIALTDGPLTLPRPADDSRKQERRYRDLHFFQVDARRDLQAEGLRHRIRTLPIQ